MEKLTLERARLIVYNRFDRRYATDEDAWWHQSNRGTYLMLFDRLCTVLSVEAALEVLEIAYSAAANEYGD